MKSKQLKNEISLSKEGLLGLSNPIVTSLWLAHKTTEFIIQKTKLYFSVLINNNIFSAYYLNGNCFPICIYYFRFIKLIASKL